jgi:TRAP transporter TAXI family solute receptor
MKQFESPSARAGIAVLRGIPLLAALALLPLAFVLIAAPGRVRAALAGGTESLAGPVTLLTGERESAGHTVATLLSEVAAVAGGPAITVVPTEGVVDTLDQVQRDASNFALLQSGPPGIPDGYLALARLTPLYAHVIVPADSDITTFRELAGKRVGVGAAGGSFGPLAAAVFDYFRFPEQVELLHEDTADLAGAFAAGSMDAAFTLHGLFAPAMEELLASGYYRLLPIPEAAALAQYLPGVDAVALAPGLYGPSRTLPAIADGPWPTLRVEHVLVAPPDAGAATVNQLLAALFEPQLLAGTRLEALDEASAARDLPVPLHPAAAAYYQRNAPMTEAVLAIRLYGAGGVLLLAAVIFYLAYRLRRTLHAWERQRLQPRFDRMADFGAAVAAADSPGALEKLLVDLAAVQHQLERLWQRGALTDGAMQRLEAAYLHHSQQAQSQLALLRVQQLLANAEQARPLAGALVPPVNPDPDTEPAAPAWWSRGDSFSQVFQGAPVAVGEAMLDTVRVRGAKVVTPVQEEAEPLAGDGSMVVDKEMIDSAGGTNAEVRQEITAPAPLPASGLEEDLDPSAAPAEVTAETPAPEPLPVAKPRPKEIAALRAPVAPARRRAPKAALPEPQATQDGPAEPPQAGEDPAQMSLF